MPQFGKGNQYRFGAPGGNKRPSVEVSADAEDFVRLLGKTSTLDKKLKTNLRKKIREAGTSGAEAVRKEVAKPPLHRRSGERIEGVPQSRGLRRKIAEGVGVSVAATKADTAGVKITASGKRLPAEQKTLLKKYNRERGWRHPNIASARRIGRAKGASQLLRALGSSGAAQAGTDIARNTAEWHEQKGRPYFGKVLAARGDELAQAVTEALDEARKSAGLP